MRTIFSFALLGALALNAAPVAIFGGGAGSTSGLGFFVGAIEYFQATRVLTVSLTNTTPAASAGWLTAFVFNTPLRAGVTFSGVSLTGGTATFNNLIGSATSDAGVNGAPFGQFDLGASTSSAFEGGGSPVNGLDNGQSATWHFTFTGTNLNLLTTADFLATNSVGPGDGEGVEPFVARFRGFVPDGSDKVPFSANVVPEPGQYAFMLIAGIGAVIATRRRRALR